MNNNEVNIRRDSILSKVDSKMDKATSFLRSSMIFALFFGLLMTAAYYMVAEINPNAITQSLDNLFVAIARIVLILGAIMGFLFELKHPSRF